MGKNKLKRFEENKTFPHVFEPDYYQLTHSDFELKAKWHSDFFRNTNPIILELGCGKGEYTVGMAEKYPDKNFIGIDIKGARLWRGAKESYQKSLPNVAFLRIRIESIVSCFDKDEVDEIWLTFPDPHLKRKKRIKKRLSSSVFLSKYQRFIKPKGCIHLKTDDPVMYAYTRQIASLNAFEICHDIGNIYAETPPDSFPMIQTHYEKMWLKEKRTIRYFAFRLNTNSSILEPPPPNEN